jgi:dephospho-CoA kinase
VHVPAQIGVTGGIGSGKSLVCKIFKCLGVPVYDADSHAKELMTTDGILIRNIKKEFGELSYHTDGSLNRNYLSSKVFNDTDKLQKLNKLVHPRVRDNYSQWVHSHKENPYVIKEAALIFEANSEKELDKIVAIDAPDLLRIGRILKRDPQRSVEQIRGIMMQQMPEDEKMRRADFIIRNDEEVLVIPQVLDLHARFVSLRPLVASL